MCEQLHLGVGMRLWPTTRAWKRIGIVVGVTVALLLVANAVMAWRVDRKLAAKIAAIRAAGEPTSIADLKPAPIPDDVNAAVQLRGLAAQLKAFNADHGDWIEHSDLGRAYLEALDRGETLTREQADAMRAILNKYETLEDRLSQVAAMEQYASTLDFSLDHAAFVEQQIEQIERRRCVGRFYRWQIPVLARKGRIDDAVRKGIELLRLVRHWENEPTITMYLNTIAVREVAVSSLHEALASGPASAAVHAELDEELAKHDDPRPLASSLVTERAFNLDTLNQLGDQLHPWTSRLFWWQAQAGLLEVVDFYDAILPPSDPTWPEFRDKRPGGLHGVAFPDRDSMLMTWVLPNLTATYSATNRLLCRQRALRVFNALRAFAEENGREASGLGELGLPAEAAIDPYSGNPLILKHTDAGWTVYGVGENRKDEGGKIDAWTDIGLGPGTNAE